MTEKVKLTQEQADGIEHLKKKHFSDESIIAAHVREPNGWLLDDNVALNRMPLIKLVDALRIGYEVVPQFEVGDWVIKTDETKFGDKEIAMEVSSIENGFVRFGVRRSLQSNILRHATPEEIKAEKERRVWAKFGRDVGKFHNGDFGISYDGEHSDFVPRLIDLHSEGKLLGFYPAEFFISFEEVDSE